MKFIPILLSTEMVQAEQAGRKTKTRRTAGLEIVNETPEEVEFVRFQEYPDGSVRAIFQHTDSEIPGAIKCPYGKAGDVLWVRETFEKVELSDDCDYEGYIYKADKNSIEWVMSNDEWKWKPSIFMPKEACRTFLQVTGIRVERLQDISHQDAIDEGIFSWVEERLKSKPTHYQLYYTEPGDDSMYSSCPIVSFESLWMKINGPQSWKVNPWVWVVSFKRIDKPANFI